VVQQALKAVKHIDNVKVLRICCVLLILVDCCTATARKIYDK